MNHFVLTIATLVFAASLVRGTSSAQGIEWEKLHGAPYVEWSIPRGDFGDHWKNGIGAGGLFRYELTPAWSLVGAGTISRFVARPGVARQYIPDITLVRMSAGLLTRQELVPGLAGTLRFSLENFTFIFTGPAASLTGDNFVESEIGVQGAAGLELVSGEQAWLGITSQYHMVFSAPERITMWSFGLYFFVW